MPTKPRCIHLLARRWTDNNGNTYHSVTIRHGETDEQLREPFEYGYGRHYQETAADMMTHAGWLPARERYANGGCQPFWRWLQEHDVTLFEDCQDVKRKRDL